MGSDRFSRSLAMAAEGIVGLIAVSSVWPITSEPPFFYWLLLIQISALLGVWGLKCVADGTPLWKSGPVIFCLAAICLATIVQIAPMPESWVAAVSPASVDIRAKFQPQANESSPSAPVASTTTISLDPGMTRESLLRMIAFFSVFAAVRNVVTSPRSFHRLAMLIVANGVILSLFGLGHVAFGAHNFFGDYQSTDTLFGPFMNRNHAADYLNLCAGLAVGLLLRTQSGDESFSWRSLFRDPRILWLACGLAILVAGVLATLSRGGLAGLVLGSLVCMGILAMRSDGRTTLIGGGVAILLTGAVLMWLGPEKILNRWSTTAKTIETGSGRPAIILQTYPLIGKFAVMGSGQGTFSLAEQLTEVPGTAGAGLTHAHNDYLQWWIEGGTLQFALALIAVAIVLVGGYRAFAYARNPELGRLALGGLMGCVAVAVHSFVDFGLHVAAVAALTAVVCGLVLNAADDAKLPSREEPASSNKGLRLAGAFVQLIALVTVASYLVTSGWREQRAESYFLASFEVPADKKIAYLKTAVDLSPDRTILRVGLGNAYLERVMNNRRPLFLSQIADMTASAGPAGYPTVLALIPRQDSLGSRSDLEMANQILVDACRRSPLHFEAQQTLEFLSLLEPFTKLRQQRLERLVQVSPGRASPWFTAGVYDLDKGNKTKGLECLRNALAVDPGMLAKIAALVPTLLSEGDLLTALLRGKPDQIITAAALLSANTGSFREEMLYYQTALDDLNGRGKKLTREEWKLKGKIHAALADRVEPIGDNRKNELDQAAAAFREALALDPLDVGARFELGKSLFQTGNLKEARNELAMAATQNDAARALLEQVRVQLLVPEKQLSPQKSPPLKLAPEARSIAATVAIFNTTKLGDNGRPEGVNGVAVQQVGRQLYVLTVAHILDARDDKLVAAIYPVANDQIGDEKRIEPRDVQVLGLLPKFGADLAILRIQLPKDVIVATAPVASLSALPTKRPFPASLFACGEGVSATRKNVTIEADVRARKEGESAHFWQSKETPLPGESGGPLMDNEGRLLGICSGTSLGKGYFTHSDEIVPFLRQHKVDTSPR